MNHTSSSCAIRGKAATPTLKTSFTETGYYYYCQVAGTHQESDCSYSDLVSGKFAYNHQLCQDLDDNTFDTHYPVPSGLWAPEVCSNVLCDGTQSYSNIYKSSYNSHYVTASSYGTCTTCGRVLSENIPTSINVTDAAGLKAVAYAVNHGADYSNTTVTLSADIDMGGVTGFIPIGFDQDHAFKGTFNGQGHRIKNLDFYHEGDGTGLLGTVSGTNTIIKNVVIDKSCTITASGSGVAGVVGCVTSTSGTACKVTIQNCGNEATVKGWANTSGILGGVYNNDKTELVIRNSYNVGNITGSSKSAAICGYARKNYNIQNCYNTGTLSGGTSGSLFYTHETGGTTYVVNCYDVNGAEGTGVTSMTSTTVTDGTLCGKLNANITGKDLCWKQGSNYPEFDIQQTGDKDYLCFTAEEAATVSLSVVGTLSSTPSLQYYDDNQFQWEDYTFGTEVSLVTNQKVLFSAKTTNSTFSKDCSNYIKFTSTGKVAASGNIMSLLDPTCQQTTVPDYAFNHLFYGCANLTDAPKLPATTLATSCYESMFEGCTSIDCGRPDLPATDMANRCYACMFKNCTALTWTPTLPATTMAASCYEEMFSGCTALLTRLEIPATALANDCFKKMLYNCISLCTIKVFFQDWGSNNNQYTSEWLGYDEGLTKQPGTITCYTALGTADKGPSTIPTNWIAQYLDNSVTLNASGYSSYSSSVDVLLKTYGVKAYKVSLDEGKLVLTKLKGYIPAGTGVLLSGTANSTVEFQSPNASETAADFDGNVLMPTTTQDVPLVDHVDAWELGSDIGFEKNTATGFTANRAYIPTAGYSFSDNEVLIPDYLCFTAAEPTSVEFESKVAFTRPSLQYSTDKRTWTNYSYNSTISLAKGEEVYFRAQNENSYFSYGTDGKYITFTSTGNVSASGNIMYLFDRNTIKTSVPLDAFCYMFYNCTTLLKAPKLPATTLGENCYYQMFRGCTALTEAPELPATTLVTKCYYFMFENCTSLKSIPDLSHCTLKSGAEKSCYEMFYGCKNVRVNTLGLGTEWKIAEDNTNNNFTEMFAGTGGDFTGTPTKDVTYYVLDQPYIREMDNQWGTICLPFAIEATGDDYDLYTITSATSDKLNLTKVDGTLAAGKPAIIRRNADVTTVSIPAISGNTDFVTTPIDGDNGLTGKFADTPLTSGYIIANNSFWDVSSLTSASTSVKCAAYHAYLTGVSGAKELTIGFDDATAVNSVNNEQLTVNNGKYIENGRVVILKNNRKYNLNGQEIK